MRNTSIILLAGLAAILTSCGEDPEEEVQRELAHKKRVDEAQAKYEAELTKPTDYVLSFNWQPAFCETNSRKRECKTQTKERYDATNFALHGLWPQPGNNVYCDVEEDQIKLDKQGQWRELRVEQINEYVWRDLKEVMPGTQSSLHKHEWVKHGTCYSKSIDDYYAHSVWLMQRLNASRLQDLFEARIGAQITGTQIRTLFEESFGKGSGDRLRISCRKDPDTNRQMITGLTLGLSGKINGEKSLSEMIMAAAITNPGCDKGYVDPVGLQPNEDPADK
ncbi:MAG: ribonuclease [Nitratireductor sp.]